MNEEIPIVPVLVAALGLFYFGYEVERRRHKLRQVFNVFDREESEIAAMLEVMVESGQLKRIPCWFVAISVQERAGFTSGKSQNSRSKCEEQIAGSQKLDPDAAV